MNDTKHTPGPWEYVGYCPETQKHCDNRIHVYDKDFKPIPVAYICENDLANTQLISAAPDLLEALETAAQYIAKANEKGAFKDCAINGDKALEYMQAVINKAKGV